MNGTLLTVILGFTVNGKTLTEVGDLCGAVDLDKKSGNFSDFYVSVLMFLFTVADFGTLKCSQNSSEKSKYLQSLVVNRQPGVDLNEITQINSINSLQRTVLMHE